MAHGTQPRFGSEEIRVSEVNSAPNSKPDFSDMQKFVIGSDLDIQTRRAQAVSGHLSDAIRCVCRETPDILACYLLDARIPDSTETGLIIAVTVNNESRNLGRVAESIRQMLRQFPEEACNTVIMSSSQFVGKYTGSEFYSLEANKHDY